MTRLGYPETTISLKSEQDTKMAIKACLTACAHMHAAKPLPICHCDVRLANVLWDPQPFLADLELAHFSPLAGNHLSLLICQFKSVECTTWRTVVAFQVPQDLSLQDWDEGTLDDKRQYTSESDVYQIGVMLLKFLEVSAASRAFADKLKSMSVSAADAAEDTYFL